MDEDGLPIVGSGVDLTKVSESAEGWLCDVYTDSKCALGLFSPGSGHSTEENRGFSQPVHHSHSPLPEPLLHCVWGGNASANASVIVLIVSLFWDAARCLEF